ncbi:MAG: hypothetical protein OXE78_05880 [Gammaproteobacteria bacterium]|nr:hypothetical protein [Gammaproteobacteria bacterium]
MLREITYHIIESDYFPPDAFTGLVILGFGKVEHFPFAQHIEIEGGYFRMGLNEHF